MLGKLIITNYKKNEKKYILSVFRQFDRNFDLDFYEADSEHIGNIYVALVCDLVPNINAAFVEYEKGKKGYLSLIDNTEFIFLNKKNTAKLNVGDYILVQLEKEAIKSKDPVFTSKLSLTGNYCVYSKASSSESNISFSKKINNSNLCEAYSNLNQFKEQISNAVLSDNLEPCSIIIRTEAARASAEQIVREQKLLELRYNKLLTVAKDAKLYSCLYEGTPSYISIINKQRNYIEQVVTDIPYIYDEISSQLDINIVLYEDKRISLSNLYGIEQSLEEAFAKRIWLKSGGFLIIEPTEAMTIIDVNTGKYQKGRNTEDTFLKINLEAASEIGRQLRLRNISGIIIVDFIDMTNEENKLKLVEEFRQILNYDPIKTTLVDMTKLGLVELTRMKTKKSVEQLLKQ